MTIPPFTKIFVLFACVFLLVTGCSNKETTKTNKIIKDNYVGDYELGIQVACPDDTSWECKDSRTTNPITKENLTGIEITHKDSNNTLHSIYIGRTSGKNDSLDDAYKERVTSRHPQKIGNRRYTIIEEGLANDGKYAIIQIEDEKENKFFIEYIFIKKIGSWNFVCNDGVTKNDYPEILPTWIQVCQSIEAL